MKIKNRFTGEVIHSFNGTIKECVEDAIKNRVNLRSANLTSADLRYANLRYANLRSADLTSADLRSADLRSADLTSADLTSANLRSADLTSANLTSANLTSADLTSAKKVPIYCKWSHGITNGNLIHIGCEERTIEEWDKFFASEETISTERNTPEFKQIEAVFFAYKAYLTHLSK